MRIVTANLLFEMLHMSIEEPLKSGDSLLTKRVVREPMILVRIADSAIVYTLGWDTRENFNVLSLN